MKAAKAAVLAFILWSCLIFAMGAISAKSQDRKPYLEQCASERFAAHANQVRLGSSYNGFTCTMFQSTPLAGRFTPLKGEDFNCTMNHER